MKNMMNFIKRFSRTPILVIGDLMVDKFIWGDVSRISPEAPVPVLENIRETWAPGGSGNVVNNLSELGLDVHVAGIIGKDPAGRMLIKNFKDRRIHHNGIITDAERPTIIKSRIIARNQQVLRMDIEKIGDIHCTIFKRLLRYIAATLPVCKAVIISDYGKGVVDRELFTHTVNIAKSNNLPVFVDPKIEHFKQYKNITCLTPNIGEAQQGMNVYNVKSQKDLHDLGKAILKELRCDSVLITRGEKGMDLFLKGKMPAHIPVTAREIFDVTGAGDTVIAVLAASVACGADLLTAARLSSFAAGCVVEKVGTATVSVDELTQAVADAR